MRKVGRKFFLLSFPAVFLMVTAGCASLPRPRSPQYSEAPPGSFFLTPFPDFNSAEFSEKWSGAVSERDKIRYLLDRVATSKERFLRNGEAYEGPKARQWLLFKLTHWARKVETAEDFVTRVASFSQKTGEPYGVEFPEGKVYSLKSILNNELSAFEKNRTAFNARSQTLGPASAQISTPPVFATRTSQ